MTRRNHLGDELESARGHLRAVAFRMLGSADDAEDAIQETWLRASTADLDTITNVPGWLTTILSRVCLDMLRARKRRRRDLRGHDALGDHDTSAPSPAEEHALVESVGLAMLVVLARLGPLERVAFVLHDAFAVPFDEIAEIVARSPVATKKLASRARQRIHGSDPPSQALDEQREIVEAFLRAARAGDVEALVAVLAPDVVRRVDRAAHAPDVPAELRGAAAVAKETSGNAARAQFACVMRIDGVVGAVVAPRGRLRLVLKIAIDGRRITAIDVVGESALLDAITLTP